jgi:chaperonin GroES
VEAQIVAKVNIKPLEDKILVQANEAETTTASGLVIPDTAKEKPQEGTVVAVGPGRWDEDGDKRIPLDASSSTASTAAPRSSTTARNT